MRKALAIVVVLAVVALAAWLLLRERDRSQAARPQEATAVARRDAPLAPADAATDPARLREEAAAGSRERPLEASAARDGATMRVRVVDVLDGRAVAGARVTHESAAVETGADGWCTVDGLDARDGEVELLVEARGYGDVRWRWVVAAWAIVELTPTTTFHGRVLDAQSREPVAGAELVFTLAGGLDAEIGAATSDASGQYALEGVPVAFPVNVTSWSSEHATAREQVLVPHRVERVARDFLLERGTRVSGQVVDFVTGAPVPGARLERARPEPIELGPDGRFDVPLVPNRYDGRIELDLSAPGWCRLSAVLDPDELGAPLVLRITRGAFVEGVVRDADGRPVPGATVGFANAPSSLRRLRASENAPEWLATLPEDWRLVPESKGSAVTTDAEGRFRSSALVPASENQRVDAWHETLGRAREAVERLGAPGSVTWLAIALEPDPPAAVVSGTVRLNGQPCEARVEWRGPTRGGGGGSAGDGRYRLVDVEPGEVTLVAGIGDRVEGRWIVERTATLDVAEDGERVHDFDVRVPQAPIAGRVGFSDGSPALGMRVFARNGGSLHGLARTGPDGRFSIDVPDVGETYRVGVSSGPTDQVRRDVTAGTTDVDFELPSVGELVYRVVDAATGEPVPIAYVAWRPDATREYVETIDFAPWRVPDPDGWLRLELPAGNADLHVDAMRAGYTPLFVPGVPIVARAETRRVIELERGATLRFTWADGPPDDHDMLLLETHLAADVGAAYPVGTLHWRKLRFDEDGVATVRALASGNYRFVVDPADVAIEPETIDVRAGMDELVTLGWRAR